MENNKAQIPTPVLDIKAMLNLFGTLAVKDKEHIYQTNLRLPFEFNTPDSFKVEVEKYVTKEKLQHIQFSMVKQLIEDNIEIFDSLFASTIIEEQRCLQLNVTLRIKDNKAVIVSDEDGYSALYVNGLLVAEGNPLGEGNSTLFLLEMAEKYSFTAKNVSITNLEYSPDSFPINLFELGITTDGI